MRTNPFSEALQFLFEAKWTTVVFWILLLASLAVAARNWKRDPTQRTFRHVWTFGARLLIGAMWWQQSLWKIPPTYTDRADGTGGLRYWVGEMVRYAAFPGQSHFAKDVVLPHFGFFAPQVYLGEVFVAVSLMLGVFTRLGGTVGALMAANLWLGPLPFPGRMALDLLLPPGLERDLRRLPRRALSWVWTPCSPLAPRRRAGAA